MVITCEKKELVQALQIVLKAVANKPQMPILSGVYIKAADNKLELQATDYELSIITTINATVEEEGIIVLPGKYLYEVVRTLPGDYLAIKNSTSDNAVNISSQTAQFSLLSMDENQFPTIDPLEGKVNFSILNSVFINCIRKTSFSCASEENRPVFTGCLIDIKDDQVVMAATNMHRLAMIKEPFTDKSTNDLKIIVPAKILNEFTHIFNSKVPTEIKISCTHNKISFSYENIYVISRLIEGQFPDYSRVIPQQFKTNVTINKAEFRQALDRVALISRSGDYNIIHFEYGNGIVRISSDNPNIGRAEETMKVDINGPDIEISFNASYIIDVLKVLDKEKFVFSFNQPLTTAAIHEIEKIKDSDDKEYEREKDNFTYVVTPVRTKAV